jgi:5'-3' exonuclease
MIVVDFNQTAISNLMMEIGSRNDIEVQVPLLRHMILNSIRSYKQKFGKEYGEIVIACDNQNYWRREVCKFYKAGRKKAREASGLDWKQIFEALNLIRSEIDVFFPYKVINVDGAEADDVIAVLAEWSQANDTNNVLFSEPKPFLVLSGDHDFIQLQKYENVKQFSPVQKKYVKSDISPEKYLFEHIIRGDKGDGIPNVLSADDSIVTGTRQKAIRQDKLDIWYKDFDAMPQDAEFKTNYERNRKLVSFDCIPASIKESIINTYTDKPIKDKSKLLNFFVEHKMKNMLEVIEEF